MIVNATLVISMAGELEALVAKIVFFLNDVVKIHPHNNVPMLITVRCDDWKIKRLLMSSEAPHTLFTEIHLRGFA